MLKYETSSPQPPSKDHLHAFSIIPDLLTPSLFRPLPVEASLLKVAHRQQKDPSRPRIRPTYSTVG
jgi:hypothetical protein